MTTRKEQLQARLDNLRKLKQDEVNGENNYAYISDLNSSIGGCERELKFLAKNPDGVEMVNGS